MQIPGLDTFGNSLAPAPQPVGVQRLDAGQGLQAFGQDVQRIGSQELSDERQRLERENAARLSLAMAKTQNGIQDAHDEVARGVIDGSIPTEKAGGELQQRVAKVKTATLDGIGPEQRAQIDPHLETLGGSVARSLTGVIVKRKQNETASTIDQFGEQVSREAIAKGPGWASEKYGALVDFSGSAAGWTPEVQAAKKQAFKEHATYSFFSAAGTDALLRDDIPGITGVIQNLGSEKGDPIDPQKRNQLTHQLFGWQQSMIAKHLRAQNAQDDAQRIRDNEAGEAYNKGVDLFQSGKKFDPEFITELTTKGSGTVHQQDILGLLSAQAAGSGFATKPALERDALIARMEAAGADPAVGTNPMQQKAIEQLRKMNEKLKHDVDDNPWAAASAVGRIPPTPQINAADPGSAIAVMKQRMQYIGTVEDWARTAPGQKLSPLQPAEVEQIGKMVRMMPPDQAATMLSGFGAAMGDSDRIGQVAKQIKDKDGTLSLAMLYAGAQTTQGRQVAELVLRGDQAIKDKAVTVDGAKETGWTAEIAKQINGAYPNLEVQEATKKAAFLIMAARNADPTQASTDIENAVTLATGGIVDRSGAKVPLPYGMKESDFDKRIDGYKQSDLISQVGDGYVLVGRTPMPLAEFVATIPKAQLVHAGQGMYNVRAGTTFVTNSAGKRIVLKP